MSDRETPFAVHPDVRRAETPPGWVYSDSGWHREIVRGAFVGGWHHLEPGSVPRGEARPFLLAEGCLDEPLLRTCSQDGSAWIGSNVCTHRGARLCDQAGPVPELRCKYHGRAFALDGSLLRAPGFDGALDFPRPEDSLPSLPLETFGPLEFTSLSPAEPFADWIAPVRNRFGWCPWDRLELDPAGSKSFHVEANWALYVENYLEGFHIPFVHPGLRSAIEGATYRTSLHGSTVLQLADAKAGDPALEVPIGSEDAGSRLAGIYLWLFPGLMLNLYPFGLSLNRVVPESVDRTRIEYRRYVWAPEHLDSGAGGDLDQVELEDQSIVQEVQRGVRSRLYTRGRYAPKHETGTHHFHRLLDASLRRAAKVDPGVIDQAPRT